MPPHISSSKIFLFVFCWVFLFCLSTAREARATHIRAGEILVLPDSSKNDPRCVIFKLITYTDFVGTNADNPKATLFFGTGDKQEVTRQSRTVVRFDTYRSVYYFQYCFPSAGTYTVTYTENNRATNVLNIEDSQNQSFLLRTTITIDPFIGVNNSPALQVAPLDYASCGQVFVHNPGAFDKDGDRLVFRLRTPQRNLPGGTIDRPLPGDVIGYRPLNDPSFNCQAVPSGGPSILTIDSRTGQLTWNAPCLAGDYNVAFVVEEYRGNRKIGEVLRDMQIRVRCTNNLRPTLRVPRDTCVVAGTTVVGRVRATDPNNHPITLEAYSQVLPPATFTASNNVGTFSWTTTCQDIQKDTVQVTFRAVDVPNTGDPLADIQSWRIRVVGPAPTNFAAGAAGRNIRLTWNPYQCQNATRIVIYRREGPTNFAPGPCETGIPVSAGFIKIGEVDKTETSFTDTGGATGLKRGVSYCYVIYAEFAGNFGRVLSSLATQPICLMLENSVPVLTNVSVESTGATNGSILVKWTKPQQGLANLPTPLQYRLLRAPGATPQNFTEVFRTNNLDQTSFLDANINTTAGPGDIKWVYKLEFYQAAGTANEQLIDTAPAASSVQLKATSRAKSIVLNWTYDVPWDNSRRKHYIYRKVSDEFLLIDSVNAGRTSGQYVDQGAFRNLGLKPNQVYCYYVRTNGTYGNPALPDPLLNKSQEFCVALKDSVPPCPPVLSIDQLDCEAFVRNPSSPPFQNVLTWVPNTGANCDPEIKYYTIYFKATEEAAFDSIGFTDPGVTTFTHRNLTSYAGCYVVTATDPAGNESANSNTVCKDNCFFFQLPNIFTPNGDGRNDTFRPDERTRFVKSIRFTVFNRWGEKVYEGSEDPNINWRGVNQAGKQLADGTYYYVADVEFFTLNPGNAKRTYKGWVEIVR